MEELEDVGRMTSDTGQATMAYLEADDDDDETNLDLLRSSELVRPSFLSSSDFPYISRFVISRNLRTSHTLPFPCSLLFLFILYNIKFFQLLLFNVLSLHSFLVLISSCPNFTSIQKCWFRYCFYIITNI